MLAISAQLPSKWSIEKAVLIKAQPFEIFQLISHFENWSKWTFWSVENGYVISFEVQSADLGAIIRINSVKFKAILTITHCNSPRELHYQMSIDNGSFVLYGIILLADSTVEYTQVAWRCTMHKSYSSRVFRRYQIYFLKKYMENAVQESIVQLQKNINTGVHDIK